MFSWMHKLTNRREFVPPRPFVVLFQVRSGSSYLVSVLNSHPDVYCRYEDYTTLGPDHRQRQLHNMQGELIDSPSNDQTQQHLLWMFHRPAKASGFKLNFPHQYNAFPEILMMLLKRREDLKVIHLDRQDRVKRLVSLERLRAARQRNWKMVSSNFTADSDLPRITIDIPEFLDLYRLDRHRRGELQYLVSQFPQRLTVNYEQLLETPHQVFGELAEFLSVGEFQEFSSPFTKGTPDDLSHAIENHQELLDAINTVE